MSEVTEVVVTPEQELSEVMAGYAPKARADEAPAKETPDPAPSVPAEEPAPVVETPAEPVVAEPDVKTLAEELAALKAKVASSAGEPESIRKLHGEIGNINRTLKALQTPAAPDPSETELQDALKSAERAAEEYPDLAGPLVKALKLSLARTPKAAPAEDIGERVTTAVKTAREQDAKEALLEEHPDYITVRETPEYKAWLASKTPEFQERFNSTWNPAVVAKGLTEFKTARDAALKAKERKQDRLAAAVTPQGVPQQAKSSTLPDEEGFSIGYYQKGRKRLT